MGPGLRSGVDHRQIDNNESESDLMTTRTTNGQCPNCGHVSKFGGEVVWCACTGWLDGQDDSERDRSGYACGYCGGLGMSPGGAACPECGGSGHAG